MLINKFNNCIGITLFRFLHWKLELWIVPAKTIIPEHCHPHIDSKLIPVVFGANEVSFVRNNSYSSRSVILSWPQSFLRAFRILHTDYHYVINNSKRPLVFLNIERWLNKMKPSSASIDFELRKAVSYGN